MINKVSKNVTRQKRHLRIRQTLVGTEAKPRLNVFRSNKRNLRTFGLVSMQ